MPSVRNLRCIFYTYSIFQFKIAVIHALNNHMTCLLSVCFCVSVYVCVYLCVCFNPKTPKPQERWRTCFPFTQVKGNLTLLTVVQLRSFCWTREFCGILSPSLPSFSPASSPSLLFLKMDLPTWKQTKDRNTQKEPSLWRLWHFYLQKQPH